MTALPDGRPARVLPPAPVRAAVIMLVFTAALYVFEAVDQASGGMVESAAAIYPRSTEGLTGVLTAPLVHDDWAHLAANSLPFLIFGFLAMSGGPVQWFAVTATIWLVSGLGVWLVSPAPVIGASGIVFGWFLFLLVRGFYARNGRQILLALVLFLFYGSILWGVLPSDPSVSWQGHLFGAVGGVVAAYWVAKADRLPS
ncbi:MULTISPECIES: rhomboid family intramembrane serine protease [Pseudonocardia]|jgi:membrane associated rhomboid family serine protease|uniref:Membrane associated rhomboid family serine protease n=1 Tax=Pseudonocardia alni TaxID=33907 RepID=A0A852W2G9_PSEA5|nr:MULTISPECIES: rhomboid family intramembrane serine protease [Pseudonocardia]OJG05977.1 Rhomboid family protein [Pseudonocardia autotrophica]MCO7191785.1 rhomboid family intramembrane serine protease [Pseudonocardia sp. McavD-2-B]MYW70968.1 rhomboid family intramembrane serine protease [Pseudonocardia sp. SID8383]NYG01661.1 membrane associated rhomboid family serine protease [Pseudonocardia antarctica]PKB32779.1 membrane associated rhomboid family serine protease [Pseudonocardia alni]